MEYIFLLPRLYSAVHLTRVQYSKTEAGWTYPNHRHPYFEFLYCVSGEIEQWMNGQRCLLHPGDALIIKPNIFHHTRSCTDSEFFDFHFDIEQPQVHSILQSVGDTIIRQEDAEHTAERTKKWVESFIADFGVTVEQEENGIEAGNTAQIQSTIRSLQMQSRILSFIAGLIDCLTSKPSQQPERKIRPSREKVAHEVAYLLEMGGYDQIQIGNLADQLHIHRSHITSCFKEVYGVSPRVYYNQIRIRKAKELLQETDLSVTAISERLSFSSAGHFSRFFHTHVGFTPLAFRAHSFP